MADPMDVESTGASSAMTSRQLTRMEQTASLPWVEKYRPKDMSDLVSHEEIISTINKLIDANKLPHLMLYGPPGTGKTSTILACAHKMYGKSCPSMVLELNASDERGIDVVREQIKEFASTRQMFTQAPKLIILDEADAMTNPAQFALRRVIEKYTRNVRFCIICNYASKIIPALQSRCTRFRFAPLEEAQALERLNVVARAEGVNATADGLDACVALGEGDMRKCINILQSTHMAFPEVSPASVYQSNMHPMHVCTCASLTCMACAWHVCTQVSPASVYQCTGAPMPQDVDALFGWLLQEPDFGRAYTLSSKVMADKGLALQDVRAPRGAPAHPRPHDPAPRPAPLGRARPLKPRCPPRAWPQVLTKLFELVVLLDAKDKIAKARLIASLSDVEHRLSVGTSEKLQLAGVVGLFQQARAQLLG